MLYCGLTIVLKSLNAIKPAVIESPRAPDNRLSYTIFTLILDACHKTCPRASTLD